METLKKSLVENYKQFIGTFITEEGEKYLTGEKNAALLNNKEYQQKKAELSKMKAEILAGVTNKLYAHKLAINFSKRWKIDADTLETMIADKNGIVIRDGKKVSLSTIAECASFMAYLYKSINRTVKETIDKQHEIYTAVCGGLLWNTNFDEVANKVAKMKNVPVEDVRKAYLAEAEKVEKAEKAKAETETETK